MERTGLETRDIHADGTMTLPLKKKGEADRKSLMAENDKDIFVVPICMKCSYTS